MKIIQELVFKRKIRAFLVRSAKERQAPWRNRQALKSTVDEVLGMDDDLLTYVRRFLDDPSAVQTELKCEIASISELLATGSFTPVSAALFVQWYRREPKAASEFMLHHDAVVNIPMDPNDGESISEDISDAETI